MRRTSAASTAGRSSPVPNREYQQTLVDSAKAGVTEPQLLPSSLKPAMRTTVVAPSPWQWRSRRPLGVATIVVHDRRRSGGFGRRRRGAAGSSEQRERDEDERSGPGAEGGHGPTVRPQGPCRRLRQDGSCATRRRDARDPHLYLTAEDAPQGVGLASCHEHSVVTSACRGGCGRSFGRTPARRTRCSRRCSPSPRLVSVKAVYDEMSDMDHLFQVPRAFPIVISMLALTVPLAWRRRYPLGVAVAVVAAFLVARIVRARSPRNRSRCWWLFVAFYSAAVYGRRPLGSYVLLACELAVVLQVARELFLVGFMAGMHPLSPELRARLQRRGPRRRRGCSAPRSARLAVVSRSSPTGPRELVRERERNAEQAVFAERVRIARELHDVVAHHVSVMGVQAGAARRVMARQPKEAAEALSSIEGSSRTAVLEMQRLLGFLRSDGDSEGFGSQPGLDRVGDLVAESQRSDLDITLTIQGEPRPLSPTLDVSAYRIVQEALTNSRKHSTGRTASVRIQYSTQHARPRGHRRRCQRAVGSRRRRSRPDRDARASRTARRARSTPGRSSAAGSGCTPPSR